MDGREWECDFPSIHCNAIGNWIGSLSLDIHRYEESKPDVYPHENLGVQFFPVWLEWLCPSEINKSHTIALSKFKPLQYHMEFTWLSLQQQALIRVGSRGKKYCHTIQTMNVFKISLLLVYFLLLLLLSYIVISFFLQWFCPIVSLKTYPRL